jgi:hypothetical protein
MTRRVLGVRRDEDMWPQLRAIPWSARRLRRIVSCAGTLSCNGLTGRFIKLSHHSVGPGRAAPDEPTIAKYFRRARSESTQRPIRRIAGIAGIYMAPCRSTAATPSGHRRLAPARSSVRPLCPRCVFAVRPCFWRPIDGDLARDRTTRGALAFSGKCFVPVGLTAMANDSPTRPPARRFACSSGISGTRERSAFRRTAFALRLFLAPIDAPTSRSRLGRLRCV